MIFYVNVQYDNDNDHDV